MSTIAVGVVLPSLTAQREQGLDLRSAARHAESVGLASVWHGDHLAIGSPVLDVTVALATVAAVTERISIGAGVFVPALRPLAVAAKQVASLQVVSGGRLVLGVGSGGGPAQWAGRDIVDRAVHAHSGSIRRLVLARLSPEQAAAISAWSRQLIDDIET